VAHLTPHHIASITPRDELKDNDIRTQAIKIVTTNLTCTGGSWRGSAVDLRIA